MKIKNIISKGLIIGLLFSNSLASFAGILSDDERYETFEGDNITIDNILEENTVDIDIEGNTLVNIYNKQEPTSMGGSISNEGDMYRVTKDSSDNRGYLQFEITNSNLVKSNTVYTVILKDYFNNGDNNNIVLYDRTSKLRISNIISRSNNTILLRTNDSINTENRIQLLLYVGDTEDTYLEVSNEIVLIEGDYMNQSISYFEGMQSSFENNLVTQEMVNNGEEKQENLGKYKVEVKSTGKNLFDGFWEIGHAVNGVESFNDNIARPINFIEVQPNRTYRISKNEEIPSNYRLERVNFYKDGTFISHAWTQVFTVPSNCNQVKFLICNKATNDSLDKVVISDIPNFQLEEGSLVTDYKPYKEYINTFYLNSPLLERDTIEYNNGQAYHVKRSGKVILDGSQYIQAEKTGVENKYRWNIYSSSLIGNVAHGNIIRAKSDKYNNVSPNESWNCSREGISQNNANNSIHLFLEIYSNGSDDNKRLLINELKSNPATVVYELANPIYEPIKADLSVQLFEGTTHISNNSNIPANMQITVDRTINRATEAVELAKSNPTVDNISKARYWTNLLKETINKDIIQNEINNITEIEELSIENKSVTSNVDVYIKSQNGLSMTLSTNSIIFDDFDSTEDMEKLNAVNLTVNSSLPYQLNSYMITELKNNDNTEVIPKELFNIRLSGEDDYKAFTNINEKLVLKEDCEKGNNNQFSIDLILRGSLAHKADIYKTTIKFEAEQK